MNYQHDHRFVLHFVQLALVIMVFLIIQIQQYAIKRDKILDVDFAVIVVNIGRNDESDGNDRLFVMYRVISSSSSEISVKHP